MCRHLDDITDLFPVLIYDGINAVGQRNQEAAIGSLEDGRVAGGSSDIQIDGARDIDDVKADVRSCHFHGVSLLVGIHWCTRYTSGLPAFQAFASHAPA